MNTEGERGGEEREQRVEDGQRSEQTEIILNAKRQEDMREREQVMERRKTQKRRLTKRAQETVRKTIERHQAKRYWGRRG